MKTTNQRFKKTKPSKQFINMDPAQRQKYIQSQEQSKYFFKVPVEGHKFPEINFFEFYGSQGGNKIKLATYRNQAKFIKRGVVCIIPSNGKHCGLFAHLAGRLSREGYTAVGFDVRGSGRSEGDPGMIDSCKQYINDAINFVGNINKMYPNMKIYLMGQFINAFVISLVSIHYKKKFNIAGLFIITGIYKIPTHNSVMEAITNVGLKLINILPNKLGIFNTDFSTMVRSKMASSYLENDPYMYTGKFTIGTLAECKNIMDYIDESQWGNVQTPPIVIIHGQFDKVGQAMNAINFYQRIKTKDKELWFYSEMWSSPMLDQEYWDIQENVIQWLKRH